MRTSPPGTASTATRQDVELARNFVAFAENPSSQAAGALPFAPKVRLGLGRRLSATLGKASAAEQSAWTLGVDYFRGYVGPFNTLELIQHHATKQAEAGGWPYQVSLGEHPQCAGPPAPAPKRHEALRRVSVQPSEGSIDSCLAWFTVDLFFNPDSQVTAITLDIWEP